MMKWKKDKASSSHQSLITHVFPVSWFSKFKQKNSSSHQHQDMIKTTKQKAVGKQDLSSPSLSTHSARLKEGRFYSREDDPYWRLSFSEDGFEAEKSAVGWNSFSFGSINEFEVPFSKIVKAEAVEKGRRKESQKFNCTVNGKMARQGAEYATPRRKSPKDEKLRKLSRRDLEERLAEMEIRPKEEKEITPKSIEKDIIETEPEKEVQTREESQTTSDSRKLWSSFPNPSLNTVEGDYMFEGSSLEESNPIPEEEFGSERVKLEEMKIKEIKMKIEQERKSIHIPRYYQRRRRKQSIKVGAYSPRTTAKIECKIKALEDMKRTKMKMRKKMKEKKGNDRTAFDSFAVVKSSFDPEQDFKDSMVEMITQIGIKHPEELEELLACYLTLNCDHYHPVIIKVFRQVWFELNQVHVSAEIQNNFCCDDLQNFT